MKAVFYRDQLRQIRETDMNQCTKEREYILKHLASIFHTGVFCLRGDECIPYEENPAYNPLYNSEALRGALRDSAGAQREPVLVRDDFHMIYICVREENICYMMGPLSMQVMSRTERHRFYHFYGIDEKWEKGLHYHTLMEILQIAGMFAKIITGQEYTDQELMDANYQPPQLSGGEKNPGCGEGGQCGGGCAAVEGYGFQHRQAGEERARTLEKSVHCGVREPRSREASCLRQPIGSAVFISIGVLPARMSHRY